jgi:PAS domain S-box-containing protein
LREVEESNGTLPRGGLKGVEFAGRGVGFTRAGLTALLDQLPVALAVTRGPKHIYIYANTLYRAIHEPALGKLAGRAFSAVFGDRLGADYIRRRDRVLNENVVLTERDVHIHYSNSDTYWDITLVPVFSKKKKPEGVLSISVEVTDRVHARIAAEDFTRELQRRTAQLEKERKRMRVAVDATGIGIWEWHVESNRIYWSLRQKQIFGLPTDRNPTYSIWEATIHAEDRGNVLSTVKALLKPSSGGELSLKHRIVLPDGTTRWIESRGRMLYVNTPDGGRPTRLLGTTLDVTERQEAEQQLHDAMAMKDMLLRETHHRVKNSLQIISAMLSLQERVAASGELKASLNDASSRIRTVASLHEQLHRAQSTTAVEISTYLSSLCKDLAATVTGSEIAVEYTGDTMWVANERAISIALIVNELTTNALKYAYPDGRGVVRVSCLMQGGDRLKLIVQDAGVGLPENFDARQSESLGMLMAQTMSRQLGGEILHVPAKRGARFELVVNIREE